MAIETLLDACREVMRDSELGKKYPKGVSAGDVLTEIRLRYPDAFPLVSVLDVANEMIKFFGPPTVPA